MSGDALTLGPGAREVVVAVADGSMPPQEGALRLLSHWAPAEMGLAQRVRAFFRTRGDSLADLDALAVRMENDGHGVEARRVAEMNWILAQRTGSEDARVRSAATLGQLMEGDWSATDDRLALLEFAVPRVLAGNAPAAARAGLLAHLADARFFGTGGGPRPRRGVTEACERALAMQEHLDPSWRARLHFVAGTEHSEGGTVEALRTSVGHLRAALDLYDPDDDRDSYASTLNNLGNSLRELGALLRDRALLHEAVRRFDQALPLRGDGQLAERTRGNRALALAALARLDAPDADAADEAPPPGAAWTAEIQALLRTGDEALADARRDPDRRDACRRSAATRYLEAMRRVGRDGTPGVRAEVLHRLAGLLIQSEDADSLRAGVCLVSAAERLSAGAWREVSRARLAYHKGRMLVGIGAADDPRCLPLAEPLLRGALQLLREQGHPGEADEAEASLALCAALMAAAGAEGAEARALELFTERARERLEESGRGAAPGPVERAYAAYLARVRDVADGALAACLGRLALETVRIATDQGYDEYNRGVQLLDVARRYRDAGDLQGTLDTLGAAEDFARRARYSAPSLWCLLAEAYAAVPLPREARRCLREGEASLARAAGKDEAVLPGDDGGRWIPELGLDHYRDELAQTTRKVEGAPAAPAFDPAATAWLLHPGAPAARAAAETRLAAAVGPPAPARREP